MQLQGWLSSSLLVKPPPPRNLSVNSGILPTVLKLSWENQISTVVMELKFNIRYRISSDTNWMEVTRMSLVTILLQPGHLPNYSWSFLNVLSHLRIYVVSQWFIWLISESCDLKFFGSPECSALISSLWTSILSILSHILLVLFCTYNIYNTCIWEDQSWCKTTDLNVA